MATDSSDYLVTAGRDQTLLTRLSGFLHGLRTDQVDLDEKVAELRKTVSGQLWELGSACTAMRDLQSRERTGRSAIQPQERQGLIERITSVELFCDAELLPALRRLLPDLAGRPEAAAFEKFIHEVEARASADMPAESWKEERSLVAPPPGLQVSRSEREVTAGRLDEPVAVAVSSILLESLQAHQEQLGDYIQGYIRCQRFSERCEDTRETFERARTRGLEPADWDRVRKFLNEMYGMANELGPGFRGELSEFQESVAGMENALKAARALVRTPASFSPPGASGEIAASLLGHFMEMRNALDDIATLCPTKADRTLGELRDVINRIFGEIGRQREARRHVADRAGERAIKFPARAPERTDITAEKGG